MNQVFKVVRSVQFVNASKNAIFARNFVGVCSVRKNFDFAVDSSLLKHKTQIPVINSIARAHTKGERELVEFLAEEILAEKKAQKVKTLPADVEGFAVTVDGSEVELKKDVGGDKVIIKFNVNHTVDAEEPEVPEAQDEEFAEMKSKPNFEVDIVRNKSTLSFTCSFLQGEAQEGEYNDVFGIDEITIFEGEHNEKNYAVAGDVLDGYLYDLLMNFLEEKGISNSFAEKLSEFSTAYEHQNYIKFLDQLSNFTGKTK